MAMPLIPGITYRRTRCFGDGDGSTRAASWDQIVAAVEQVKGRGGLGEWH